LIYVDDAQVTIFSGQLNCYCFAQAVGGTLNFFNKERDVKKCARLQNVSNFYISPVTSASCELKFFFGAGMKTISKISLIHMNTICEKKKSILT
jgi:hypothetical protein